MKIDIDSKFEYKHDEDVFWYHVVNMIGVLVGSIIIALMTLVFMKHIVEWFEVNGFDVNPYYLFTGISVSQFIIMCGKVYYDYKWQRKEATRKR